MRKTKDLKATAYHEAGHVVAAVIFKRPFKAVSIKPDYESLGRVSVRRRFYPKCEPDAKINKVERAAICILAGGFAEARFVGKFNHPSVSADRSISNWLTSKRELPPEVLYSYLAYLNARTRAWVKDKLHWLAIKRVAKRLLKKHKLTERQVTRIVKKVLKLKRE